LVRFLIVLILTHDRSMVCADRTMGMETILGTPDGTPTVNVDAREVHGLCQTYHRLKNNFGHT
jgi:hypothetical protein